MADEIWSSLGPDQGTKKVNKRGWSGKGRSTDYVNFRGRVWVEKGELVTTLVELMKFRMAEQNVKTKWVIWMDVRIWMDHAHYQPPSLPKRNREQDSWMDSWTAPQLDGWLDGWIDWTDWRPKCQSTFAVEARRRSMSMRCECRKCWPPVHKLKALSHTNTHTHQSEQWTPPKPPWNENEKWYFWFCGHS